MRRRQLSKSQRAKSKNYRITTRRNRILLMRRRQSWYLESSEEGREHATHRCLTL